MNYARTVVRVNTKDLQEWAYALRVRSDSEENPELDLKREGSRGT